MASSAANPNSADIIDLVSDDSDHEASPAMPRRPPNDFYGDGGYDFELPAAFRDEHYGLGRVEPEHRQNRALRGEYIEIDGDRIFIPDEDQDEPLQEEVKQQASDPFALRDYEIAMGLQRVDEPNQVPNPDPDHNVSPTHHNADRDDTVGDRELAQALENSEITADRCLQRVLEIFPDICHEHVVKMYDDFGAETDYENLPGQARLDNIIDQLVSATSYPKQQKGKLKRKREDSIGEGELRRWEGADRPLPPTYVVGPMRSMLKAEFPDIPHNYINETLKSNRHFYPAYIALAKTQDNAGGSARPYGKGRAAQNLADADTIATNCEWPELIEELRAARTKMQMIRHQKRIEDAKNRAEKENLEKAIAAGETAECSCCFDDLPMNRQIHCNGLVAHFTCYDCALTYIKTEVGESKCQVMCTAGCGAGFGNEQLNQLSDKPLLEKLAQLQQEKDIRDAGLDDLEECPFCDYKAILPPIEEDFEFRCANPECEKVSCRRCKSLSHIPISCEQHAKDNKINNRHKIEEAMTAALIRSCNKCKKTFIKDFGCNKMRCPSCSNMQCYVCSQTITDYNHFDQNPAGTNQGGPKTTKCPLYDNVEERHEREVKEAEAAARAQVVSENPDVSVEDLEIKVSDAVKQNANNRIRQAGGPGAGMIDMLAHIDAWAEPNGPGNPRPAAQVRRPRPMVEAYEQEMQALRHRQQAHLHQQVVQNANRQRGLMGGLQGFIPVYGLQQPQQAQPGAAAPPPQQQGHQAGRMRVPPRFHLWDPWGGPDFGGDGAQDFEPPQQQPIRQPDIFADLLLRDEHFHREDQMPAVRGIFAPPGQGYADLQRQQQERLRRRQEEAQRQQEEVQRRQEHRQREEEARRQLQADRNRAAERHLEALRQQHDDRQRLLNEHRERLLHRGGRNRHYQDYEEQMRRQGRRH